MPQPLIKLHKSRLLQVFSRSSLQISRSFPCGLALTTTNTPPGTSPDGPIRTTHIPVAVLTLPLISSRSSCTCNQFLSSYQGRPGAMWQGRGQNVARAGASPAPTILRNVFRDSCIVRASPCGCPRGWVVATRWRPWGWEGGLTRGLNLAHMTSPCGCPGSWVYNVRGRLYSRAAIEKEQLCASSNPPHYVLYFRCLGSHYHRFFHTSPGPGRSCRGTRRQNVKQGVCYSSNAANYFSTIWPEHE